MRTGGASLESGVEVQGEPRVQGEAVPRDPCHVDLVVSLGVDLSEPIFVEEVIADHQALLVRGEGDVVGSGASPEVQHFQQLWLLWIGWKLVFMEQRAPGTLRVWSEPFVTLRVPKIYNLRTDPYERADITSNTYYDWVLDHAFMPVPAQAYVGKFLATFKEYPQRQKAASFNLDEVMAKLKESSAK